MCHEPTNISPVESNITINELDDIPLSTRRSLIQSSERVSQPILNVDNIVKREDDCSSEMGVQVSNGLGSESINSGILESTSIGCNQGINDSGNIPVCRSNSGEASVVERIEETTVNNDDDELEHLTLKQRRRMLLESMALRLSEVTKSHIPSYENDIYKVKAEISCKNGIASSSGVEFSGFLAKIDSALCKDFKIGSESGSLLSETKQRDIPVARKRSFDMSPEAILPKLSSQDDEHSLLASNGVKRLKKNHLQPNDQVKVECLDDCVMENNGKPSTVPSEQVATPNPSSFVKKEAETASEMDEDYDEIDHMKLIDRIKLPCYGPSGSDSPSSEFNFSTSEEYIKPVKISRPWKRKKTATDSIETALEEDAPGLLKVLLEQGVKVDELRLYGEDEEEGDDSDDSQLKESFSDLEDVIAQLFIKRVSGPKLLSLSFSKTSKACSYCVTCLFSLIQQARHLRSRKWPVEWGWCRDLQSFIFVFERHNRIVMERPEYGYATYFFELSNTASIGWQVKRLVLAMKLASCGRYQLIENKALLVGQDMTEKEAEVLMKYGWIPNTGLGTMLNYRDRVYHDRKSKRETSEWKSNIAKLLIDGYNSGTIVSTSIDHGDDARDVKPEPYQDLDSVVGKQVCGDVYA